MINSASVVTTDCYTGSQRQRLDAQPDQQLLCWLWQFSEPVTQFLAQVAYRFCRLRFRHAFVHRQPHPIIGNVIDRQVSVEREIERDQRRDQHLFVHPHRRSPGGSGRTCRRRRHVGRLRRRTPEMCALRRCR
jgi:hypothetical protein